MRGPFLGLLVLLTNVRLVPGPPEEFGTALDVKASLIGVSRLQCREIG